MNIKKISVIIPCYKNEKTIQSQLLSTIKILEKTKIPFEIIVVIDGEFDNTSIQVKKVKSRKIKVFVLKKNRGKGYAFKFGFSKSSGDTIILFDGRTYEEGKKIGFKDFLKALYCVVRYGIAN